MLDYCRKASTAVADGFLPPAQKFRIFASWDEVEVAGRLSFVATFCYLNFHQPLMMGQRKLSLLKRRRQESP